MNLTIKGEDIQMDDTLQKYIGIVLKDPCFPKTIDQYTDEQLAEAVQRAMEANAITSNMNKALGDRIRALRCAKNLTQEQLADQVGISRQVYAMIEDGAKRINLDILSKIVEVLDVTVSDITSVLDQDVSA